MSSKATDLATEAFQLADGGKLAEAVPRYREALARAQPECDDLEQIHREFASVLSILGEFDAALEQRRLALDAALNQDGSQDSSAVVISRHFLGDLLLRMERPEEALAAIRPSLGPSKLESVLRIIEARAHHRQGRVCDALAAARRAVECARSESGRNGIREQLSEILDAKVG